MYEPLDMKHACNWKISPGEGWKSRSWVQGWKVEGFAWLFLKDRSSRSKPTGCRFVCFFCGFPSIASIMHQCHLLCLFCLEFVAKGATCDTQEYVNHKHHGKDSGGDLERWMVNITSPVAFFSPATKKGGLFHGLGNPTPPKKITGRIQGFVKWEAVNFL